MKGVGIRKPRTQASYEKFQRQLKSLKHAYWDLKLTPSLLAERLHELGYGESKTLDLINSWKAIQKEIRDPKNNRVVGRLLLGHLSYPIFNSIASLRGCVTIGTRVRVKEQK